MKWKKRQGNQENISKNIGRFIFSTSDRNLESQISFPFNRLNLIKQIDSSNAKRLTIDFEFLSYKPAQDLEVKLEQRINTSFTTNFLTNKGWDSLRRFAIKRERDTDIKLKLYYPDQKLPINLTLSENAYESFNIVSMFNESPAQKLMPEMMLLRILERETKQKGGQLDIHEKTVSFKIPFKNVAYADHRVTIAVSNSRIISTISLHPRTPFTPEIKANLSNLATKLNKIHHQGHFHVTSSINYVSKFYAFEYSRFNGLIAFLVQDSYNTIILSNLSNFTNIIKNNPKKISLVKKPKQEQQIELYLSAETWDKERKIYERMSKDTRTLFFKSRFCINLSKFMRNNAIRYFFKPSAEDLYLNDPDNEYDMFESFADLIQELAKHKLGFKRTGFIQLFKLFDEKLSYTYKKPLSCIIEIYDKESDLIKLINQDPEFTKKGKFEVQDGKIFKLYDSNSEKKEYNMAELIKKISFRNLFLNLREILESRAGDLVSYFSSEKGLEAQDLQKFVVDKQTAIDRIELSKSCNYSFILNPLIFIQIPETNQVILYYKSFKDPLKLILQNFSDSIFSSFIQTLLSMLKQIQIKNSRFACFDLDCLGYSQKGKLKILLKSSSEIDPEFQAPEVRNGRNSRFSLIYSIGILIRALSYRLNDQTLIEWAFSTANLCTKPNVFKRARIDNIMN